MSVTEQWKTIFRWETMQVVGPETLPYPRPVTGSTVEIQLRSGRCIQTFRADDGVFYFCHGLTFGGTAAPGGAVSPYSGHDVMTILDDFFRRVSPEADAVAGDVMVWYDLKGRPIHSALLLAPAIIPGSDRIGYGSVLRSKNSMLPEADVLLRDLVKEPDGYGEAYTVLRLK